MRAWRLWCPQCARAYVVDFHAPWSCPNGEGKHGPIEVRGVTL